MRHLILLALVIGVVGRPLAAPAPDLLVLEPDAGSVLPRCRILAEDADGLTVVFSLPALEKRVVEADGVVWHALGIAGGGVQGEIGDPGLPTWSTLVSLPEGTSLSAEVLDEETVPLTGLRPLPRQPLNDGTGGPPRPVVDAAKSGGGPAVAPEPVLIGEPGLIRHVRVAPVTFQPVRYDPATGTVTVARRMTVRLSRTGKADPTAPAGRERPLPDSFVRLLDDLVLDAPAADKDSATEGVRGAYVLVYPNATGVLARLEPLLAWRRQQGYHVIAASMTEAGATAAQIKTFLQDVYDNGPVPLEFVVLAGDAAGPYVVPTWRESLSGFSGEGDHYYTTLAGSDNLADAHVGRLSYQNLATLETMVAKILAYETNPSAEGDPGWYRRACLVGDPNPSGYSCIYVNQWVKSELLQHGYAQVDTIWQGVFPDRMLTALNRGDTIFGYRGFYGTSGWSSGYVHYLSNGGKLPFGVVLTCMTGAFATEPEALSESWLRASGGGGIGCIGTATPGTHTRYNNTMYAGIMDGLVNLADYRPGVALTAGKLNMYRQYAPVEAVIAHIWSVWNNLMGDPATEIWTAEPAPLYAVHPAALGLDAGSVTVDVIDDGGLPVAGARVSVHKPDEITVSALTDGRGRVVLALPPATPGVAHVTVTAHDRRPYRGTVSLGLAAQHLDCSATLVRDDLGPPYDGDGDGDAEPGETFRLDLEVTNRGLTAATGIAAVLAIVDPHATVIKRTESYPDLAAGESAWSKDGFRVLVHPDAPAGHAIPCELTLTADGGSWTALAEIPVHGGACAVEGWTWGGDGETPDPGESGELVLNLRNVGDRDLGGVTASLSSRSPAVWVEDGAAAFGPVPAGEAVENAADPFSLSIAVNCFQGHLAAFDLDLVFADGARQTVELVLEIGTTTASDPLGPDRYGYFAFDNTDVSYPLAPDFEWIEISPLEGGTGTEIPLTDTGLYLDDVETIALPFPFRFYGRDFTEVSVCSNGWLAFGRSTLKNYRNYQLPCPSAPENLLAVFWDDLFLDAGISSVAAWHDTTGGRFVVEWSRLVNQAAWQYETFEVVLHDPAVHPTVTGDGLIVFQYRPVQNVDDVDGFATVGIQNGDHTDGLCYTYWNRLPAASAPVAAGRAIAFVPAMPTAGARIGGQVTNATDGSPVAGALVSTLGGWTLATHEDGHYSGLVPAGTYDVTAGHPSFAPDTARAVTFLEGELVTLDFVLSDVAGPVFTGTTRLGGTTDTAGPYAVETTVADDSGVSEIHFHYTTSHGGPYASPLVPVDPETGRWWAEIPGQPLDTVVQYWLTCRDGAGNPASDPPGAPWELYRFTVAAPVALFADDMEEDRGWTVGAPDDGATAGIWERCDPNGVWHDGELVQPEDDATPDPGVTCWITGNDPPGSAQGTDDVDIGRTTLTSPLLDLSACSSVTLSYRRWYSWDTGFTADTERWRVYVTDDDGASWAELENTTVSERAWVEKTFDLENHITPTALVRLRYVAADMRFDSVVEAGLDDVRLVGFAVAPDATPPTVSLSSPDGGETLTAGTPFPVAWEAVDDHGVVHVELFLSTDGGATYPLALDAGPLTVPHAWTPPAISSGTCRLRVVVHDVAGRSALDESAADFAIVPGPPLETPAREALSLLQNRPNPFNPRTEIFFSLPRDGRLRLRVYDLEGRLVRTLVDGVRAAGPHRVVWDGTDDRGARAASGAYLYRLEAAGGVLARKMLLLK